MKTYAEIKAEQFAERKAWLTEMSDRGLSMAEAAREAGEARSVFYKVIKRHEVRFIPCDSAPAMVVNKINLLACQAKGLNQTACGRYLGVSHSAIWFGCKKHGVQLSRKRPK